MHGCCTRTLAAAVLLEEAQMTWQLRIFKAVATNCGGSSSCKNQGGSAVLHN
jgi:hypothetical protein